MRLQGKAALIFGGTSGIGAATAQVFAAEGAKVSIVGRSDAGADVVARIVEAGGTASFIRGDVINSAEIESAIGRHVAAYGALDVLFNNAAAEGQGRAVVDTTEEELDRVLASNVKSVFLSCKYAAPYMIGAKRGSIINTSAASAREGLAWPGLGAYIASKGAVISFTRALAVELAAHGIRVNSLNPGLVDTPMLRRFAGTQADPRAFWSGLAEAQLLGRIAQPRELANAALFLASEEGSFVTGTDLLVDGGLVLA
ncbi:MAG TPA: SDR family oxidoreductase [Steroidobacteraceae bacterium]|nr:SDR family oxidoreductase [Steroidobacteraceae bacterium]